MFVFLELNAAKSSLSNYNIEEWQAHTQKCNPSGQIVSGIQQRFIPEMCTQAWCKFYEIINQFRLLEQTGFSHLNSLHLCEAPGGFIAAINHYYHTYGMYVLTG